MNRREAEDFAASITKWSKVFLSLVFLLAGVALAKGNKERGKFFANGEAISVAEKKFSIIPPNGWEVVRNHPGTTLYFQIPFTEGMKYQKTIQVMVFKDRRYLDELAAKDFRQTIETKFSLASSGVQNYRVRSHTPVKVAQDRPAILYYSEFNIDGLEVMQAHLLLSSHDFHYLVTYTDLREVFESPEYAKELKEAWDSMISITVEGGTPNRQDLPFMISVALAVIALISLFTWAYRWRRESRSLDHLASTAHMEEKESPEPAMQWDTRGTVPTAEVVVDEHLPDDLQDDQEFAERPASGD